MDILILISACGLLTGFLSGMLGIGGGIIMAPLLLYLPQITGMPQLTMHTIAGLTIVQGLAGCISGVAVHHKFSFVSTSLIWWMGTTIFVAALIGGAAAVYISNDMLMAVFAVIALAAAMLVFVPTKKDCDNPDIEKFTFSRVRAVTASGAVGLLGGSVGQGGSFILIPLMTSYMQVPTRIAVGSNLGIVFLSSLAAFLGKALTGQIDWLLTVPVIVTVVPAAQLGGRISRKVPVPVLRRIMAVCIALAAVRIGINVFV